MPAKSAPRNPHDHQNPTKWAEYSPWRFFQWHCLQPWWNPLPIYFIYFSCQMPDEEGGWEQQLCLNFYELLRKLFSPNLSCWSVRRSFVDHQQIFNPENAWNKGRGASICCKGTRCQVGRVSTSREGCSSPDWNWFSCQGKVPNPRQWYITLRGKNSSESEAKTKPPECKLGTKAASYAEW